MLSNNSKRNRENFINFVISQVQLSGFTQNLAGWLVGWLAGWLVGWLAGWLVGWLVGWLAGWLVGWLACWLAGWLVGWLAGCGQIDPDTLVLFCCVGIEKNNTRYTTKCFIGSREQFKVRDLQCCNRPCQCSQTTCNQRC